MGQARPPSSLAGLIESLFRWEAKLAQARGHADIEAEEGPTQKTGKHLMHCLVLKQVEKGGAAIAEVEHDGLFLIRETLEFLQSATTAASSCDLNSSSSL